MSTCAVCGRKIEGNVTVVTAKEPVIIQGMVVAGSKPYELCIDCQVDIVDLIEYVINEGKLIVDCIE